MNNKIYGYDANELGLTVKGYSGNGEVIVTCPSPNHNDNNPSACFNTHTGLLFCFSCGYSANINMLSQLFNVSIEKKSLSYTKLDSENLWQEFKRARLALDHKYLENRCVTNKEVNDFSIRKIKNGIVFLFHNLKGKFVGCQIRKTDNTTPKYLTFGERICYDLNKYKTYNPEKPIYLTEGVFGMIRGYQSGYQTLAVIGAMLKKESLDFLQNWRYIYGVFDNDLAGYQAGVKLLRILPQAKIVIGATADEMSTNEWQNIHDDYLVTGDLLQIARLSGDKERVLRYV